MSFLVICLLSWLIVFICWATFLVGVEFGRAGLPDGVDLMRSVMVAAYHSVIVCSPILLVFALLIIGVQGL